MIQSELDRMAVMLSAEISAWLGFGGSRLPLNDSALLHVLLILLWNQWCWLWHALKMMEPEEKWNMQRVFSSSLRTNTLYFGPNKSQNWAQSQSRKALQRCVAMGIDIMGRWEPLIQSTSGPNHMDLPKIWLSVWLKRRFLENNNHTHFHHFVFTITLQNINRVFILSIRISRLRKIS